MSSSPTTTHASGGAGHPHLVIAAGGPPIGLAPDSPDRQRHLNSDVTTIGSDADCDIRLGELLPLHARVVRDVADEFRVFDLSQGTTTVDGVVAEGQTLHTGDRLAVGPWTLVYAREEFADHGRPNGGRQGGEGEHTDPQPVRELDDSAPLQPRKAEVVAAPAVEPGD